MDFTLDAAICLLFPPNNDDLLPAKFDLGTKCEAKIKKKNKTCSDLGKNASTVNVNS
jgi:hypothetical protein